MKVFFRDTDGSALVEQLGSGISEWELIASGTASQSPYHQWRCAFYLGRSGDSKTYALQLHDYGDPDEEYEDDDPYIEIVAVMVDAGGVDADEAVRTLLAEYQERGGKYIEEYEEIGDFDFDEDGEEGDEDESSIPASAEHRPHSIEQLDANTGAE